MTVAILLFAAAAVGGLVIARMRFKGKPYPPMGLALVHGAAAAAGLLTLLVLVVNGQAAGETAPLVLFIIAALGGFGLFFHHLRKAPLPIWLVVVHAVVAVIAFLMLLF